MEFRAVRPGGRGAGAAGQETERGHASWDLSKEMLLARAKRRRPRVDAHEGQRSGPAHKVKATQETC